LYLITDDDLMILGIERDIASRQDLVATPAGTSQQGMQTCNKFIHDERLGEIVIGAVAEALDPIFQTVAARHDQDGRYVSPQSQIAKELETILVGKAEVENDRGVVEGGDRPLGIGGTFRLIAVKAHSRQVLRDKTGKLSVVFNNENPHRPRSPLARNR
jgi:hypothetical protein